MYAERLSMALRSNGIYYNIILSQTTFTVLAAKYHYSLFESVYQNTFWTNFIKFVLFTGYRHHSLMIHFYCTAKTPVLYTVGLWSQYSFTLRIKIWVVAYYFFLTFILINFLVWTLQYLNSKIFAPRKLKKTTPKSCSKIC